MKMNLTTDPWIPVVWQNGQPGMVSLTETFQRGANIQDLAVRPHERIALMRLLICIAQAALDGPKDHQGWHNCRSRIAPDAADYLKRWHDVFELFGDKQRFLQVPNLKPAGSADEDEDGGNSVSKLDLALATGNNSTLFDNAGGSKRDFTPAQLALMLLTFQCFSPCGRIGVAAWNGNPTTGNGSSAHAPCVSGNMLHSYLRHANLLDTIHSNLLDKQTVALLAPKEGWGNPVWEQMPQSPVDESAICNASATYLGRFVPLTRAIRLSDDGKSMILANGLSFLEWREPSSTIKVMKSSKGTPERKALSASLERAPWRELHSLTVRHASNDPIGGPVALRNVTGEDGFDLWAGGLVAAGNGKLEDPVEAVFHVPIGMLTEPGQRIYEDGVKHAGDMEFRLRRAVSIYHKELGNNLDRPEMREQRKRVQSKATFQFWTDIERDVQRLLEVVADSASLTGSNGWPQTVWGKSVWGAVLRAFDAAGPHGTPRQMQAFVLARQALFRSTQPDISKDKAQEIEA